VEEKMMFGFRGNSAFLLTMLWSTSLLAAQCYAPSDPVRLTSDEQRSVVLTSNDNPTVFQTDFSLKRTLKAILASAPGVDAASIQDAQIKDFLNSLLAGLGAEKLENKEGHILLSVTPRDGEKALTANDLLDDTSVSRMVPVGLFNRLDLAPADHSNCGEYRIVYEKSGPKDDKGNVVFDQRMTIIFEAKLPNPDRSGDRKQCEAVWRLWQSFSVRQPNEKPEDVDARIAPVLARFYYDGGELDSQADFAPVVSFDHYGLLGGQVRANVFVRTSGDAQKRLNWHLRQWRVDLDQTKPGNLPTFQPEPVNETPFRGYFSGELTNSPDTDKDTFRSLSGLFQSNFIQNNVPQLTAVDSVAAIAGGDPTTVADLIDNVGVDIEDRFYAVDSDAGPFRGAPADADDPAIAASKELGDAIERRLGSMKLGIACGLTKEHILIRTGAMTCGGCHQFATTKEIAPGIRWPASLGFVHINEKGQMSPLLLDRFLPFRFGLLKTLPPAPVPASSARTASLRARLQRDVTTLEAARTTANVQALQGTAQELRRAESSQPGAFVTFRKPD
jgi:hypothetical protein